MAGVGSGSMTRSTRSTSWIKKYPRKSTDPKHPEDPSPPHHYTNDSHIHLEENKVSRHLRGVWSHEAYGTPRALALTDRWADWERGWGISKDNMAVADWRVFLRGVPSSGTTPSNQSSTNWASTPSPPMGACFALSTRSKAGSRSTAQLTSLIDPALDNCARRERSAASFLFH